MKNTYKNLSFLSKLSYILLKSYGYVQFSYADLQNENHLVKSNKLIIFLHTLFILCSNSIMFTYFYSMVTADTYFIAKLLILFNAYFICTICLGVICWSHAVKQKMFLLFQTVYKMNEYFKTAPITVRNSSKIRAWAIAMILIEVTLCVLVISSLVYSSRGYMHKNVALYLVIVSIFIVLYFSQTILVVMYIVIFVNATVLFQVINQVLDEGGSKKNGSPEDRLRLCARLHARACGLTKIASEVTALPSLITLTAGFVQLTLQMYGEIISDNEDKQDENSWSLVFLVFVLSYRFVEMVMVAEGVNHRNNGTKRVLQGLITKRQEQSALKEIRIFFIQVLHYDAKISAGGFFDIDYPLGYSIVAGIVTYLIILVQTDPFASQRVAKYIFNVK